MSDNFEDFINELQNRIHEDTRKAYGDVGFERWLNPLYAGTMKDPDGYGRIAGSCGDTMEIYLRFDGDRVCEALFRTDGCGASTVCGSFAAESAHGRTPDELAEVSGEMIIKKVGSLPEEEQHCAFLAAQALQEALHDYMIRQKGRRSK